jgi:hypothetical protein
MGLPIGIKGSGFVVKRSKVSWSTGENGTSGVSGVASCFSISFVGEGEEYWSYVTQVVLLAITHLFFFLQLFSFTQGHARVPANAVFIIYM